MGEIAGWLGGADSVQALAALFSAITAALAVIIALWNGYTTRQGARSSIEPAFSVWGDYPGSEADYCTVSIANKGFGPAIVTSFDVYYAGEYVDGHLFNKIRNVLKKTFANYLLAIDYVKCPDSGYAFGANEELQLARFRISDELIRFEVDGISARLEQLTLILRYRDIYRRKWIFAVHQLKGITFRDSKWLLLSGRERRLLDNAVSE